MAGSGSATLVHSWKPHLQSGGARLVHIEAPLEKWHVIVPMNLNLVKMLPPPTVSAISTKLINNSILPFYKSIALTTKPPNYLLLRNSLTVRNQIPPEVPGKIPPEFPRSPDYAPAPSVPPEFPTAPPEIETTPPEIITQPPITPEITTPGPGPEYPVPPPPTPPPDIPLPPPGTPPPAPPNRLPPRVPPDPDILPPPTYPPPDIHPPPDLPPEIRPPPGPIVAFGSVSIANFLFLSFIYVVQSDI
ncbi:leucine-rich repeat extensin-like protein 3 [Mercurialis annua]|uniref:leucine-rich repeat extensin-like protein 3 n=1 Tax=Mercurialis annua TaxID=3986 RepID=UPI0024AE214D|nr:leucine-rich repeat extensin-like protein 3 [Mercurialis annua]